MIIGFDGKRAVQNNTGLGNYSRLVVEKLAQRYPDNSYLLYAPHNRENPRLAGLRALSNVAFGYPETTLARLLPAAWRTYGITHRLTHDHITLYHGLSGELPLNITRSDTPTVVTVHDLIFRRVPQNYKPHDRAIYDYKFRRATHTATRIIAISQRTKQDIVTDYGIDPGKIDVVYQGVDSQFHHPVAADSVANVRTKYNLQRPYIISVGTLEPRKNQLQAVEGLAGLPADLTLVLVGHRGEYARTTLDPAIARLGLRDRVIFLEGIPFTDLPPLYAGAIASTYTSIYEGFGLPVVESLSTGTPVIVATGSCLEEAGGPATPAVAPTDTDQWVNAMRQLINDSALREQIARQGKEYVERFNHDTMADNIMATYRRALEEKNQPVNR